MTPNRSSPSIIEVGPCGDVRSALTRLGVAFDIDLPVSVHRNGEFRLAAGGFSNGDERAERTCSRQSGQRPAGQRPARRSRASSPQAAIGGGGLRQAYEAGLVKLRQNFDEVTGWHDRDGLWLEVECRPLGDFGPRATVLCALPDEQFAGPRAWAFWNTIWSGWVGPRHCNAPGGSICAFPEWEGYWEEGGDLTTLFELYSDWLLRHAHLRVYRRWIGKQRDLGAAYRLAEFLPGEWCTCGRPKTYFDCCREKDLAVDRQKRDAELKARLGGLTLADRKPPIEIVEFIAGRGALPEMARVHPRLAPQMLAA